MAGGRAEPALRRAKEAFLSGDIEEAARSAQPWVDDSQGGAEARHLLGLCCQRRGHQAEALEWIRSAIQRKPDHAGYHHNLGGVYRELGQLTEASSEFRQAIVCDPQHAEAYSALAGVQRFQDPTKFVRQVEKCLSEDPGPVARRHFHFAAGQVLDRANQTDRAFEHFAAGNRLQTDRYDLDGFEQLVVSCESFYSEASLRTRQAQRQGPAASSQAPIFVVGMPRSGTSLVEQVLASHSQVWGAGELPDLRCIYDQIGARAQQEGKPPEVLEKVPEPVFEGMARSYLARLQSLQPDPAPRFVDKQPLNFRYLGLAAQLFPQGRVIHVQRDVRDSGLSGFFQNFTQHQEYSFDLRHLGRFAGLYLRLMRHWREVLPRTQLIEVHYEDLVQSPESAIRSLLDRLGLAFEATCLSSHATRRVVRTASAAQVRAPIHSGSIGRWKAYERHLAPFLEALGSNPLR